MEYRELGKTGMRISRLGFGGIPIQRIDAEGTKSLIRKLMEAGVNYIDTARGYTVSEEYLGYALEGVRDKFILATKGRGLTREAMEADVATSLRNLRTDYIDLVLLHWPYGDIYAAWRDLEAMNREGLVRAIGVSNFNTDRLIDLMNYNEIAPAVNQIETNLYAQRLEEHEWLERLGVAHEGYMPFGHGRMDELFQSPRLLEIAARHGKSTRQVALRYQLQCGVIIIPKSVHRERIKANADVFDFELSPAEMLEIRSMDKGAPMTGTPETPERVMKITGFRLPDGK